MLKIMTIDPGTTRDTYNTLIDAIDIYNTQHFEYVEFKLNHHLYITGNEILLYKLLIQFYIVICFVK